MYESVKHPTHYNHGDRKECWDEWVDKFGLEHTVIICLGSADKYLYRAGTKKDNSAEQDIAKAKAFLNKAESLMHRDMDSMSDATLVMWSTVAGELFRLEFVNYD